MSHGSLGGGYELSIEGDQLVWTHSAHGTERSLRGGPVPQGTKRVSAEIEAQPRHDWHIVLRADDVILADGDGFPAFVGMAPLEGIDIGRSRRSPVSWSRHCKHGAYPYHGSLRSVTYTCGVLAPDALESQVSQLRARQITFD